MKFPIPHCINEEAVLLAVFHFDPHARHGCGRIRKWSHAIGRKVSQGQEVGFRFSLGVFHADQGEDGQGILLRKRNHFRDFHDLHRAGLAAKPPAVLQVVRENIFQLGLFPFVDEMIPILRDGDGGQSLISLPRQLGFSRFNRFQDEPVEGIPAQREQIRQIADGRKFTPPE